MQSQITTKNVPLQALLDVYKKHIMAAKRLLLQQLKKKGFIQKIATLFQGLFKDDIRFSKRTMISQIVQKCRFPVYSKTMRLELFASTTSLHFSFHLS